MPANSADSFNKQKNWRSTLDQEAALSAGSVTSRSLVTEAFEQLEKTRSNNAFISFDKKAALEQAEYLDKLRQKGSVSGPLHGIPIVVKDNVHVTGMANTAGTPALKEFVPPSDAEVITRLRRAGAIILGKTNMHELAYGITSGNLAFGRIANAVNREYFAGGSSGGTAVAIASGVVAGGLGTDTGGSSRIPAALNGIAGFRPTTGRYPASGLTLISSTRDTVGPMGKTVADVSLLDSVLSGETQHVEAIDLKEIRFGVPRAYFFKDLEPAIAREMERLLNALRSSGARTVDVDLHGVEELNGLIGFPIVLYETGELLPAYLEKYMPGETLESLVDAVASPDVMAVMQGVLSGAITEEVYLQALETHRPKLQENYASYFLENELDVMIFPTTPLTARALEGSDESVMLNGKQIETFPAYIRNTDPGSNAGIPGLTVPLGTTETGMPFGVEIDGPAGSDRRLLAIGRALEAFINNNLRYSE